MELERATFKKKEEDTIPKGAKILNKSVSLSVEEIENGYIITKTSDIKYKSGDSTDYSYTNKKWFAKENPLEIDMDEVESKALADNFED